MFVQKIKNFGSRVQDDNYIGIPFIFAIFAEIPSKNRCFISEIIEIHHKFIQPCQSKGKNKIVADMLEK
jgi:hypothetical protein